MADVLTASKQGNADTLQHLLCAGYSADETDDDGRTALYWAACYGHNTVCQYLLNSGVRTDITSKWGSTPLHAASDRGHLNCVKMLTEVGTDINRPNHNGDTALHLAAFRGHLEVVDHLLSSGADVHLVNAKSKTPIQEAESLGHYKVLRKFADYLAGKGKWRHISKFQASRIPQAILLNHALPSHSQRPQFINQVIDKNHSSLGCQSLIPNTPYISNDLNKPTISSLPVPPDSLAQNIQVKFGTRNDDQHDNNQEKETAYHQKQVRQPTEHEWLTVDKSLSRSIEQNLDKQTAVINPIQNEAKQHRINSAHMNTSHETLYRIIGELENKVRDLQMKIAEEKSKVENLKRSNRILQHQSVESNQLHIELQRNNETLQEYVTEMLVLERQISKLQQEKDEAISHSRKLARELYLLHKNADYRQDDIPDVVEINQPSDSYQLQFVDVPFTSSHRRAAVRARGLGGGNSQPPNKDEQRSIHTKTPTVDTTISAQESIGETSGKPRSDHHLYLTVRPVFQSADQRFLDDLTDSLRRRLSAMLQIKRQVLETVAGEEWHLGAEYQLIYAEPINHIEEGNRDGSCSLIYRITHKGNNYILKMMINLIDLIYRRHGDGQSLPLFLRHEFAAEYHIPSNLTPHRNIINILHHYDGTTAPFKRHLSLIIPPDLDVQVDMASRTTFMVMEEYPATLADLIKRKKQVCPQPPFKLPDMFISLCLYQLLAAVSHLNQHAVVHRDIKAENVLLDSNLRVVLGDFGFSRQFRNQDNSAIAVTRKEDIVAGNACAWAPELVRLSKEDPPSYSSITMEEVYAKSDVFAVGMLFYKLLRHEKDQYFPNACADMPHYMDYEIPDLPACYSEGLSWLIRHIVCDQPHERLSAWEAFNRVGCVLFGPGPEEVFSLEDCRIWLQAQMMECVVRAPAPLGVVDSLVLTVDSATGRLSEELRADFLSRTTCEDLWSAFSAAREHCHHPPRDQLTP